MEELAKYIQEKGKTHLIFDFDETLGRLLLPWDEWFNDVRDKIAEKAPNLQSASYVIIHNKYVKSHGEEALKNIRNLNEEFEIGKLRGIDRNPGLISFINNNPQFKYYIWSSNSRKTIEHGLQELGLSGKFSKIVTRSETKFIKPDPNGFSLIADSKVGKEKYLLIGDSNSDERAASTIGIDFFKIDYFGSL